MAVVGEGVGPVVGIILKDGLLVSSAVGGKVGRSVLGCLVGNRLIVGDHVGRFVVGAFVGKSEIVGDHVGRLLMNSTGALVVGAGVG